MHVKIWIFSPLVGICAALGCDASGRDIQPASDAQPAQTTCMLEGAVTVQGSVSVAGPVQVTGAVDVTQPVRMVAADSDPSRHVQISKVGGGSNVPLIQGPFFLTDIGWTTIGTQTNFTVYESNSSACDVVGLQLVPDRRLTSGLRYFVAADQWLCAFATDVTSFSIAGFRPY